MIETGDIFDSQGTLVNPVNTVGVMGKGLALEFKKRFPAMYEDYRERCLNGEVKVGVPYCYGRVVNFPTKDHWRSPSRLKDIEKGLDIFVERYRDWGIRSVAFPALGCGNGGLAWSVVGQLMRDKLSGLDIPVQIYPPRWISETLDELVEQAQGIL